MFRYAFRLKKGRDRDLITWLESFGEGERSFYIRQALRAGIATAQGGQAAMQQAAPVIEKPAAEAPSKPEPKKPVLTKEEAESKLNDLVNNF